MFGLFGKLMNSQNACQYENLSVTQAKDSLAKLSESKTPHMVLDVRGPDEFAGGRIAGAKNIPVSDLASRIAEIAAHKSNPVIVYCRSGGRSSVASQILAANGFANVANVAGGILDWQSAGYPLSQG